MQRIRVLFADDQLPYVDAERNESVKKEILEAIGDVLRKEKKDPEAAFRADFEWFQGLQQHLGERFEVHAVRTFEEAMTAVGRPRNFDVAVIDLSWSGDATVPVQKRKNKGVELLEILQSHNDRETSDGYKPVIAFSQNFSRDPLIMGHVLDLGALPVPKIYTATGHQALSSAISYLAKIRPPGSKAENPALAAARVTKNGAIIAAVLAALVSGTIGLVGGLLSNQSTDGPVTASERQTKN